MIWFSERPKLGDWNLNVKERESMLTQRFNVDKLSARHCVFGETGCLISCATNKERELLMCSLTFDPEGESRDQFQTQKAARVASQRIRHQARILFFVKILRRMTATRQGSHTSSSARRGAAGIRAALGLVLLL